MAKIVKYGKGLTVDIGTGEITSIENQRKLIIEKAKKATEESNEELVSIGLQPNIKTAVINFRGRKYTTVKIKEKQEFNKIFRVDFRELLQSKGMTKNKNARLAIASLIGFITFPTNVVMVDGMYPSNEDLEKLWGLSQMIVKRTLKDLEYYQVIKRKKMGSQRLIYFNPFLVCGGGVVDINAYSLFKESTFNNEEV